MVLVEAEQQQLFIPHLALHPQGFGFSSSSHCFLEQTQNPSQDKCHTSIPALFDRAHLGLHSCTQLPMCHEAGRGAPFPQRWGEETYMFILSSVHVIKRDYLPTTLALLEWCAQQKQRKEHLWQRASGSTETKANKESKVQGTPAQEEAAAIVPTNHSSAQHSEAGSTTGKELCALIATLHIQR